MKIKLSDGCSAIIYRDRNRIALFDSRGELSFIMSFEDFEELRKQLEKL